MIPEDQARDLDCWLNHFEPLGEAWIFGYGSLMWRPDFAHSGRFLGLADGVSRSYCIISTAYRGTPERPGRVLGLVEGGHCHGIAFRVRSDNLVVALKSVWQREMIDDAYRPKLIPVHLEAADPGTPDTIHALGFLADPEHHQYAGACSDAAIAEIICQASGPSGSNLKYFHDTYQHLKELEVRDDYLLRLHQALEDIA
ncbi:MAG: gamma-glutamylcyclotransferase [Alphaproteobacteria bacterium]|nr:gamma-glutamylcyclotransferase [Alphaproteobacteria bacterium]